MQVSSAMHHKAEWIRSDAMVSEVAKIMQTDDIGALPVGKNDRLVGKITDREWCAA